MNQDETYEGPTIVITAPLGIANDVKKTMNTGTLGQLTSGGNEALKGPGIRIVRVYEHESTQEFHSIDNIPQSVAM